MVLGSWRGEAGNSAEMTLVWGIPLVPGGAAVTAELADLAVDQCDLVKQRFTLIAPDNYRGDYLDIKLWAATVTSSSPSRSTPRTTKTKTTPPRADARGRRRYAGARAPRSSMDRARAS